jgi:hypothetical protein
MQKKTRTFIAISVGGLLLALAPMALVHWSPSALAQQATGNLQVAVEPDPTVASSKGLKGVVMISALMGGAVVKQQEVEVSGLPPNFTLAVGVYDVRVEGDGMMTVVKRGVHVTPQGSTKVIAPMRPGQGVRTIEYATGGLAREEVAARLAKLEAAVAQMQKTQPAK